MMNEHEIGGSASAPDELLIELVEQVSRKLRAGEPVDVEALAAERPEYCERLRRLLPTLAALADLSRSSDRRDLLDSGIQDGRDGTLGQLGDYRIVREIGRGGMGIVYEAEQRSLCRRVALKVLPLAAVLDERQLQRFRNEALAAAQLDHPHIVGVYAVGCERGVHYYAMQYIEGHSLAEVIRALQGAEPDTTSDSVLFEPAPNNATALTRTEGRNGRNRKRPRRAGEESQNDDVRFTLGDAESSHDVAPSSVCEFGREEGAAHTEPVARLSTLRTGNPAEYHRYVAALVAQAARALEHAHQLGIIHRDIKPANLLLDARGKLWVTDFGLARVNVNGDLGLTLSGDVVGTLRYMSPEQALGRPGLIDHRTDVYALGATLYELTTLRSAVASTDRVAILRRIGASDPIPPARLNPSIPVALETIVLKALEKEAEDRYRTARDFAEDLERFVEQKPIQARRPGPLARLRTLARRHAAVLAGTTAGALVLVATLFVSMVLIARAHRETIEQRDALATALQDKDLALKSELEVVRRLYPLDMRIAQNLWTQGHRRSVEGILQRYLPRPEREDLRGFEWFHLAQRCQASAHARFTQSDHTGEVFTVVVWPDGSLLATGGQDGTIRLRDPQTGGTKKVLRAHDSCVCTMTLSADRSLLASGGCDRTIKIWDTQTWQVRRTLVGAPDEIRQLFFADADRLLVASPLNRPTEAWDVATGEPVSVKIPPYPVIAASPDQRVLAFAGPDASVTLIDVPSGKDATAELRGHTSLVFCAAFSHDGTLAATGSHDETVRLWSREGAERLLLQGHHGAVRAVAFSPDDRYLASAAEDGAVRIWDVANGKLAGLFTGHEHTVWSVAFSADNSTLISGGKDGTVRSFPIPDAEGGRFLTAHPRPVLSLAFAPDSKTLATACGDRVVRRFDLLAGRSMGEVSVPFDASAVAWAPGGTTIAAADGAGSIVHLDLDNGPRQHWEHTGAPAGERAQLAFSPDGQFIAFSSSLCNEMSLCNVVGGRRKSIRLPGPMGTSPLVFAPAGDQIALVTQDWRLAVYRIGDGRWQTTDKMVARCDAGCWFFLDGQRLATLHPGGHLELRDAGCLANVTAGPVVDCRGPAALAISPDGRTLAVGNRAVVRLFALPQLEEASVLSVPVSHDVGCLQFSPDGTTLAAAGQVHEGGWVYLWHAAPRAGVSP